MAATAKQAEALIDRTFNNKPNVMTPIIIEYGWVRPGLAYELSKGEWVDDVMFGLTVVEAVGDGKPGVSRKDLNKAGTYEEVLAHLNALKEVHHA